MTSDMFLKVRMLKLEILRYPSETRCATIWQMIQGNNGIKE